VSEVKGVGLKEEGGKMGRAREKEGEKGYCRREKGGWDSRSN
jgi:hypothetical protein